MAREKKQFKIFLNPNGVNPKWREIEYLNNTLTRGEIMPVRRLDGGYDVT
jgi:hypothetical protein